MARYVSGSETCTRLLEAGAEVFADQGFRHARVSEICRRARANAAAVNYHFGGKEQLYVAVIRFAHEQAQAATPFAPPDPALPPEERLHAFIRWLLSGMLEPGRPTWMGRLMAREMIEPTVALDFMVEQVIRPFHRALCDILASILGRRPDHNTVVLCAGSIFAQCMVYHNSRVLVSRMTPQLMNGGMTYSPAAIRRLAEHITRFSWAALEAFATPARTGRRATNGLGRKDSR